MYHLLLKVIILFMTLVYPTIIDILKNRKGKVSISSKRGQISEREDFCFKGTGFSTYFGTIELGCTFNGAMA